MKKKFTWISLIVALSCIFVGSIFASLIQTSFGKVQVSDLRFESYATNGTISALMFKPKTATAENPAPLIVLSHGYLNNREMQDLNYVELSRRGYVVVSIDGNVMGGPHGHNENFTNGLTGGGASGMANIIMSLSKLDYIDSSRIGIEGHSMGGSAVNSTLTYFGGLERTALIALATAESTVATGATSVIYDGLKTKADGLTGDAKTELEAKIKAANDQNLIRSALVTGQNINSLTANNIGVFTSVGSVAGQYDEFFFKQAGKYTGYNQIYSGTNYQYNDWNGTNQLKYEWNPRDYLSSPYAGNFIRTLDSSFAVESRHTVPLEGEKGYDPTLPLPTGTNSTINVPVNPVEEGKFYTKNGIKDFSYSAPAYTSNETFRVVYNPSEIHPWNHFSLVSSKYTSTFFMSTMGAATTGIKEIAAGNQVWWLKAAFNLVSLIGFFLLVLPLGALIMQIPFFKKAKIELPQAMPFGTPMPKMKKAYAASYAGSMDAGGGSHYEPPPSNPNPAAAAVPDNRPLDGPGERRKTSLAWTVIDWIKFFAIGIGVSLISGFTIRLFTGFSFFKTSGFQQSTTSQVAAWAVCTGLVAMAFFLLNHFIFDRRRGQTFKSLGVAVPLKHIGKMLLAAALLFVGVYATLFAADAILKVDFRIWSFDIRYYEPAMIVQMLRYVPYFFIYYFINAVLNSGNRTKSMPDWLSTLCTCVFNVLGIVLVFIIQYGVFRNTGMMWQASMNLTFIVLFPIVPILIIAGIFARSLYKASGSVWLPAFFNALLFTMITVANTSATGTYLMSSFL